MTYDKQDFEKALSSLDDELYAIIGYQKSPTLGAAMPKINELISAGKTWYDKNLKLLIGLICQSESIRKAISTENFTVELCIIIADYLVDKQIDIPIVPVVTLIVRNGMKNLCDDKL